MANEPNAASPNNTGAGNKVEKQVTSENNSRYDALFEKMVTAVESIAKGQADLATRISRMEKAVPPTDDVQRAPGGDNFNPQEKGADADDDDNYPSPYADTKPAKATTSIPSGLGKARPAARVAPRPVARVPSRQIVKADPAAPRVDVDGLIKKAVGATEARMQAAFEAKLQKEIPNLIKAHTPLPWGAPDNEDGRLAYTNLEAFVRKMVNMDRQVCGGSRESGDQFGIATGEGNMAARTAMLVTLRKALR